ncbi:MAG: cyclic nucleotide-binding domain-containing protein [Acidimicrobiia bacterium]|nr:cyclic nucleotide-binding domain-containing protein [Acidimicrobiia bacterium]
MTFTFGRAETEAELAAVYEFRYSVYVEEMGRYQGTADHEHRWLTEPEDEHSWIFFATEGDEVVASGRLTWGGDRFSERQIRQYSLAPFLDEIPPERMAVGERLMVVPRHRGTGLVDELLLHSFDELAEHDVRIAFGACEPHLLSLYLGMGHMTYAHKNINSAEAGYLIPLVSFPQGTEVLTGIGTTSGDDSAVPRCIDAILSGGGAVTSTTLLGTGEYQAEVHRALQQLEQEGVSAFDGFTDDEEARCLARSNIIECDAGDQVLKKGGAARNVFVVLGGTLEVRDDERVVAVLSRGEVFGEMAFLLEQPRGLDIYAATDDVKILSLSEGTLRKMIAEDAVVAAKLLLNISRMLCVRLVQST